MRKRRRERPNWFPPAETALEWTLIHNIISVLLGSCLHGSRQLPTMAGTAPPNISIASLNFASLFSLSSLANSCTFLAGVWRIIRNLAWSALATVPGRGRRVLFLVQLKNRRIFSLCSVCLRCNAHESDGIFFVQGEWRNLELPQSFKASGCGRWSSQGALYRGWNLGELTTHTQF